MPHALRYTQSTQHGEAIQRQILREPTSVEILAMRLMEADRARHVRPTHVEPSRPRRFSWEGEG